MVKLIRLAVNEYKSKRIKKYAVYVNWIFQTEKSLRVLTAYLQRKLFRVELSQVSDKNDNGAFVR